MLNEKEHAALKQWYLRPEALEPAQHLYAEKRYEDIEEHLHMICLLPLSRHSELPDYLLNDDGSPLFPSNLNPAQDLEKWQDAVEVAWEVMQQEVGLSHDELHRVIAEEQDRDWKSFLARAEARKQKVK
jgi:hypothetical protein